MEFAFYPPSETTSISGSVTVVQPAPGLLHVTVDNFPATEVVSVDNFPATQTVNGTLAVSSIIGALPAGTNTIGYIANMGFSVIGPLPSGTNALGSVTVSNFPSSTVVTQSSGSNLHVDVDNFPATQAISGTVAVSNFPATQPISGSVSVSNFPSNQNVTVTNSSLAVTGTFFQATQPVSGTVTALQGTSPWVTSGTSTVSGSVTVTQATGSNLHVDVDNFPATQVVSGTVTANAGTGTFAISAASLPLPTGAATSALQTTGNTSLATIATNTTGVSTAANQTTQIGNQTSGAQKTQIVDGSGNVIASTSNALNTNVVATAGPTNISATGTLTGTGQTVTLTLQGTASMNVDVSGPGFVGNIIVYEATPSEQRNLGVFAVNSSAIQMNITANGNYRVSGVPTSTSVVVAFSSYTSGTANIVIYGSTAPYIVQPYSANAANVLVTSYLNDGTGNALASYNSQLEIADIINSSLSSGTISVSTTAVAARVGASNLSNRKLLTISPQSGIIYMGASSAVTTTTGLPLYANGIYSFSFSANVTPYLIAASAITTTIFEAA